MSNIGPVHPLYYIIHPTQSHSLYPNTNTNISNITPVDWVIVGIYNVIIIISVLLMMLPYIGSQQVKKKSVLVPP